MSTEPSRVRFLLNERPVETTVPGGWCLLDLVRRERELPGTKEGCKEGDCGACVVLLGELEDGCVAYRPVTSCLVPVGELSGRHVVTIEGLDVGRASTVQRHIVDEGASQCGFCTPGIVVSLTGQLLQPEPDLGRGGVRRALSGHLCRCTGYRSLRDAARRAFDDLADAVGVRGMVEAGELPEWFLDAPAILTRWAAEDAASPAPPSPEGPAVAGGTDLFVQRGEELPEASVRPLLADPGDRGVRLEDGPKGREIVVGARTSFEALLGDPILGERIPRWADHLELMGSWQIRNRATIGGNLMNASPIGDGTILFLGLGADAVLRRGSEERRLPLERLYLGYKDLDVRPGELLAEIRIPDLEAGDRFDYEKVSKRRWLDIASVCSALRLRVTDDGAIAAARFAVGGVAPVPFFLERTSRGLVGRRLGPGTTEDVVADAVAAAQAEIAPIGDIRGSERSKRLWVRQLLIAHFSRLVPGAFAGMGPLALGTDGRGPALASGVVAGPAAGTTQGGP